MSGHEPATDLRGPALAGAAWLGTWLCTAGTPWLGAACLTVGLATTVAGCRR